MAKSVVKVAGGAVVMGAAGTGAEVVTASELDRRLGFPRGATARYCRQGVIGAAWRDRRTWQWQIPLAVRGAKPR